MKGFLTKISTFSTIILLSLICVLNFENGSTDPFYQKIKAKEKGSLIIGTSKAAQGLVPEILNQKLSLDKDSDKFLNYSFTVFDSPFGTAYNQRIKEKLIEGKIDGVFIVTVDPWSLAQYKFSENGEGIFVEYNRFLGSDKSKFLPLSISYPIFYMEKSLYEIILWRLFDSKTKLHQDGWFEIIREFDVTYSEKRLNQKLKIYSQYADDMKFSDLRFNSLTEIIDFFKKSWRSIFGKIASF